MHDHEPRVSRRAADEVGDATRALFDAFMRQRGRIPNLFRVAAHREPIGETLFAHMQAVMGPGEVDVLTKELVAIRVSRINDCEY